MQQRLTPARGIGEWQVRNPKFFFGQPSDRATSIPRHLTTNRRIGLFFVGLSVVWQCAPLRRLRAIRPLG